MWSALFSGARSELDVQDFFMVRVPLAVVLL
jgi:hypothetical protein